MMKKQLLFLLGSLLLLITLPSYADIDIVIDKSGDDDSIALLVAPFSGSTHAAKMKEILVNDLKRSGRFRFIADHATVGISPLGGRLNPEVLKKTGAGFLIRGSTRPQGRAFALETEVIDLNSGTKVAGFITSYQPNTRRIAHQTADVIFKHLTGIRGAFDTRVAYVAANGGGNDRIYQLIIADADGYNPKPVVTSVEPIMSVDWSPQGDQLVYVSFESGNVKARRNNGSWSTSSSVTFNRVSKIEIKAGKNSDSYFGDIFVTKFATTEPTISTVKEKYHHSFRNLEVIAP